MASLFEQDERVTNTSELPSSRDDLIAQLRKADEQLGQVADQVKRIQKRLRTTAEKVKNGGPVTATISSLAIDLKKIEPLVPARICAELSDRLAQTAVDHGARAGQSFAQDLRRATEESGLTFKAEADWFAVGPFRVAVDWSNETATLEYAKVRLGKPIAADPAAIVNAAKDARHTVLEPVDTRGIGAQLEQAVRVAWVRHNRTLKPELRVELPHLFREMAAIRQAGRGAKQYSLARFVVELKTFLQSEQNLESDRPIKPDAAVIENAKDPKKSVFLPNDLERGYGEGKYFQAVVQRQG